MTGMWFSLASGRSSTWSRRALIRQIPKIFRQRSDPRVTLGCDPHRASTVVVQGLGRDCVAVPKPPVTMRDLEDAMADNNARPPALVWEPLDAHSYKAQCVVTLPGSRCCTLAPAWPRKAPLCKSRPSMRGVASRTCPWPFRFLSQPLRRPMLLVLHPPRGRPSSMMIGCTG